ncbi:MAG: formate/nitrite transporter family protein [Pseudomonadota bacterium]
MSNGKLFLTPAEVHKAVCDVGAVKTQLSAFKMILLGILAGVYIGFGAHLCTTVVTGIAPLVGFGITKFLGGAVFSVGLMLVVIAGSELFTGNCMIPSACCHGHAKWSHMMKNWTLVFVGNLLGSLLLVIIIYNTGLTSNDTVGVTALKIAYSKVHLDFWPALFRGICCNWLVCLAVVIATSAQSVAGKVWGIFFPIMAFVASGFEHSIANMYFIPAGILAKGTAAGAAFVTANSGADLSTLNWVSMWDNIIPVTIGNIIGGAFFVGMWYWYIYMRDTKKA